MHAEYRSARLIFAAVAAVALPLAALADGGTAASLKVDIDEVVEAGAVEPLGDATSAGQPSAAALEVFRDSGYVAVIDLRGADENRGFDEQAAVEALGMSYVSLPIESRDAISFENAAALDKLITDFDGPVLVHCGSGNRVGALFALRESLKGADDDTALAKGRAGGLTSLDAVVEQRLEERDTD